MLGLTFLNAGILFATLATLIPLIIHLFVKNKPIKVYFSSLKFLREIIEERRKKITLNQIILLILRMLIILILILTLAKPVLKLPFITKANYHPPTAVAFILDTSPSMDYVIDQKTQIQHGIDIIKNLSGEMNEKDVSLFLTSNNTHNSLKSRLIYGSIPERDFHDINFTWMPEQMNKLIATAETELEKSQFLHKEVYVISDLQHTELPEETSIPLSFISTFKDSIRVNLSVEKVFVKKEPIAGTMQRIIEFEVVNYSPLFQRDQIVRLNINGTVIAEKMIDFAPEERKIDFFALTAENLEWNYGFVEIRNERFLPDNRFYFSFYSDPQPKIGVISGAGDIPRPIEVLAEIFLGENGDLQYLNLENFQLSDRNNYHFIIFYITNMSNRIEALIKELNKINYRCMFVLHPNLSEEAKRFFQNEYALTLSTNSNNEILPVTSFHQWHQIVGDFRFNSQINLFAKPALLIELGQNNSPLINNNIAPLIIENKDIFINIDFTANSQTLLTYPAFPIIVYRSFSWISQFDGSLNNYAIGDPFSQRHGYLKSPSGNNYETTNSSFRFNEPGIWTYTDSMANNTNSSFIAVNMQDFENQSKHNPMTEITTESINIIKADTNAKIIGQDNKGNEIWKILLWTALIFITTEMILVRIFQNRAKV